RAGEKYLLRNLVFRSSQIVIELVGLFLSHRIVAPVRDMGTSWNNFESIQTFLRWLFLRQQQSLMV
ncbi:hypothetical protein Tco_0718929, partial [Tanacetum coccineum]